MGKKTMGSDHHRLVLIVSLSSLFFFSQAICVPRNHTTTSSSPPISPPAPAPVTPEPTPASVSPVGPAEPEPAAAVTPKPTPAPVSPVGPAEPEPAAAAMNPFKPGSVFGGLVDPEIDRICHATDHSDLCSSTLKPFIHGKVDLITVLLGEIQACRERAIAASALALVRSQDPKYDETIKSSLGECKNSYESALDSLKEAEAAIQVKDIGSVNSQLSAALTSFGDCDDFFNDPILGPGPGEEGASMPMGTEDATLKALTSNCLAIAAMIK